MQADNKAVINGKTKYILPTPCLALHRPSHKLLMQTPSTAPGVVQHRLKVWKDGDDRTARDDRQDREQVGRALAAASGNSISCRGSDSFSCGQQPEAGWELVLSWLVSPTVQGGSGVSLLRIECQVADSVSLPSCPRAFQRVRKQSEVDWFSCYLPAGGL